jgi:hypothetical protein
MEREGEYGCCTLYTSLKRAMKAVKSFWIGGKEDEGEWWWG